MKVIVADDHKGIRNGIKCLFEPHSDVLVVNEREALTSTFEHRPDVLVTNRSDQNFMAAIQGASPETQLVMLVVVGADA